VFRRHLTSNFEDLNLHLSPSATMPAEVRRKLNFGFDSGIFISEPDGSMYAFFEVGEQ